MTTDDKIEITQFPLSGRCAFTFGTQRVTVEAAPGTDRDDAHTREVAELLTCQSARIDAWHAARVAERDALRADVAWLQAELAAAQAKVPPKAPARVLAPGCVRFDTRGKLWLLSKREAGWSAFGVWVDGWDDLFRRFAVRVTAHGADEHGLWWQVGNTDERTGP